MVIEEALWIRDQFEELSPEPGSTVLDIGSSTEYFRKMQQPHIDYYIFNPLRKRHVKIVHVDSREDEGVDVVCDLASETGDGELSRIPAGDFVLCSNLLEHVLDRDVVVKRLLALTKPGGVLLVTVPHVYRYHADPIDTGFRPSNTELEALFRKAEALTTVYSTILDVDCGYQNVPRMLIPRIGFRARNFVLHRLLNRSPKFDRCKVAAVVLRKAE